MSNWPALMSVDTAVSYLDGKRGVLIALIEAGLLLPVTRRHRCTTFRRADIDTALATAAETGRDLAPRLGTVGQAIESRGLGPIKPEH